MAFWGNDRRRLRVLLAVGLVAACLFAVRLHCASVYRVDSDEPQHLHVVWGVANGQVQYRDIFDNHSPLFQLLCAPLFRALGERPEILTLMRFAMIPLYLGCIACVYAIGAVVFSRRCGLLAAAMTALAPRFFCTSIEFRPDTLWALALLLTLAALLCLRRPVDRWLGGGLLLGIAFSVSMKSTVMALDLAGAGALTWLVCGGRLERPALREAGRAAAWLLGGMAVVPGLLLLRFAWFGALNPLGNCLVRHNLVAAATRAHFVDGRGVAALAVLAFLLWHARRVSRTPVEPQKKARRVFLFLAGGLYPVLLFVMWPLVTREDFLVLMPMICLAAAPLLLSALEAVPSPLAGWIAAAAVAGMAATALRADFVAIRPGHDRTVLQARFIADALRLTDPGDYVMDAKGETIYRQRPYYYVLEEMTRWKLQRGDLTDDIPETLVSKRVCVATIRTQRYPRRTQEFLRSNFVPVGDRLAVAGKVLRPDASGRVYFLAPAVGCAYALVWRSGRGEALLDGQPYTAPVRLEPGAHALQVVVGSGPMALVWARAVKRGFRPFYRPSPEEKQEFRQAVRDNIL